MKKLLLTIIAVIFLIPSFAHADINGGLKAWYRFNEGSGTTALDSSASGFKGTLVNSPTYVTGKIGRYAINLVSASTEYVTLPSGTIPVSGNDISVSFWIKYTTSSRGIVLGYGRTSDSNPLWFIDITGAGLSTGVIGLRSRDNAGNLSSYTSTPLAYNDGNWHNVVITQSGAFNNLTRKIYIDGSSVTTDTGVTWGVSTFDSQEIGAIQTGSASQILPIDASVDDLRIYNRALSASDVTQLYSYQSFLNPSTINLTPPLVSNGLVGWWTMDGKDTPGRAIDRSVSNNPGYFSGIATSTFYAAGKIGQAVKLDGVNDYANVGDPANGSLDFGTGNFTYTAWVKGTDFSATVYAIGKGINGTGYSLEFVSDGSGGGIVRPTISDGTVTVNRQYGTLQPNTWYHVAVVADRSLSTGPTVYVNGISSACMANCGTNFTTVASISNPNQLAIGQRGADNPGNYFPGYLDDVRIYNRALSATEVTQLYNNGKNVLLTPSYNTNGLIGWWTMDGRDMTNGVAIDRSGQGNNANFFLMSTSTSIIAGKIGQAFNSSVTYAKTGSNVVVGGILSTSVWVKPLGTQVGYSRILETAYDTGFFLGVNTTGTSYDFIVNSNSSLESCIGGTITTGKWTHLAATYDGTNSRLYVNGVLVCTFARTAPSTPLPLYIGSYNQVPGTFNWNGAIDDVRVYNRALSQTEVTQLYNSGINIINK